MESEFALPWQSDPFVIIGILFDHRVIDATESAEVAHVGMGLDVLK